MRIASWPIAIKALGQSIPDNITVMTAAVVDQTAKPFEEAKHGMFGYFFMKGMGATLIVTGTVRLLLVNFALTSRATFFSNRPVARRLSNKAMQAES